MISASPNFHMFFDAAATIRANSFSVIMLEANSISISTAWTAAARSVSLDWSAFDAALADMHNAIKNSTPNTNLKSFSADNRPADSERRETPVHYTQINTSGRLCLVAEIER